MRSLRSLLALTCLAFVFKAQCSGVRVITEIHYRSACTTLSSMSLPATGWISTNGSSVPFVFSPTSPKTHRSRTGSPSHEAPPAYSFSHGASSSQLVSRGHRSHTRSRSHRGGVASSSSQSNAISSSSSSDTAASGSSSSSDVSSFSSPVRQLPSSTGSCVPAVPSPIDCPASNGTLYTPPGECVGVNSYVIACDTEAGGYELASNPNVPDIPSCIQICDEDPSCVAIAYDTTTHECYEKSTVALGNVTVNPNMVFAYQQRRGGALPSASVPPSAVSSTHASGSSSQSVFTSTTSIASSPVSTSEGGFPSSSPGEQGSSTSIESSQAPESTSEQAASSVISSLEIQPQSSSLSSSDARSTAQSTSESSQEVVSSSSLVSDVSDTVPSSSSLESSIETASAQSSTTQTSEAESSSTSTLSESSNSESSVTTEQSSSTESSSTPESTASITSAESSDQASTTEISFTEVDTSLASTSEISSTQSSMESSTTEIPSSSSMLETTSTSSSSSSSAAPQPPRPTCPDADGSVVTETDGSQFLIVCYEDYRAQGDNMAQINPVPAESLGACLDLCMNQGTVCMGASFVPGTNQCWMKYFMQIASYPVYEVNSFVRGTGPGGASQGHISNQYFSTGLSPWVASSASNGAQFAVVNGHASIHLTLTDSGGGGGGIPGGGYYGGPTGPAEDVTLSQTISPIPSGESWFLYTLFGLSRPSADDPGCTLSFRTNAETLFTYDYGQILDLHSGINASGVLHQGATQFIADISCSGAGDADISFDNFVFATFGQVPGANPIVAPQVQIVQNPSFEDGDYMWSVAQTTYRAVITFDDGQALVSYPNVNANSAPVWIQQNLYAQQGQTYTLTADVYFNVGSNTECNVGMSGGSVGFMSYTTRSSQYYPVNIHGTLTADISYVVLYSTCYGSSASSVAWDNIYLTLNT